MAPERRLLTNLTISDSNVMLLQLSGNFKNKNTRNTRFFLLPGF